MIEFVMEGVGWDDLPPLPEPPAWLLDQWRQDDAHWAENVPDEPPWATVTSWPSTDPDHGSGLGEASGWGELDASQLAAWLDRLQTARLPQAEAALIDLVRGLEDLKSGAAAVQARATVAFDDARRQTEADRGVPPARRGIGVGAEIGLARRESPFRGSRWLGLAKHLVRELPCTLTALAHGELNEWRATIVARETACLGVADRGIVDSWFGAYLRDHPSIGDARLEAEIRRKVIEIDQAAVVRRRRAAAGGRRVTAKPLPDEMVQITAILSLTEGVALYAALLKAAEAAIAAGDDQGRGKGAVMADTLVERVTARPAATPCDIELMVVITDQALFGETDEPGQVDGYGPVPAAWVRRLITDTENAEQRIMVRRLFQEPGRTVQMETHRRAMTPAMRKLIRIRDQRCRMPWCNAPIRHTDHVNDHAHGGASSVPNSQGLCEACNYTKSTTGWTSTPHQNPHLGQHRRHHHPHRPHLPLHPTLRPRPMTRQTGLMATLSLNEALRATRTGDIWVFRGSTRADRAIQTLTNAPVNHVGMTVALDDLPPLMWHAELGKTLQDVWTGGHHPGVQLHDLHAAVTRWQNRYHQQAWLRQLTPLVGPAEEDALLRVIARLDGVSFPTMSKLAWRWLRGRSTRAKALVGRRAAPDPMRPAVAYCAEVVALTFEEMGLLPEEYPANWYDPGKFWSGDHLPLADGWELGREIAVGR